jgi:hypothetical protein
MTLYYEHMGWGTYTTDQAWDRRTYAAMRLGRDRRWVQCPGAVGGQ